MPHTPAGPVVSKPSLSQGHKDSPESNEYNKAFQAQLAKDMGFLKIDGGNSPNSQSSTPSNKKPLMMIPEIPPFKGRPGRGEPVNQPQPPAPSTAVNQHPLPAFAPREHSSVPTAQIVASTVNQQPLPPLMSKTNQPSSLTPPTPGTASSQLAKTGPEEELTALSSVIVPALEAAIHRRSYMLKELGRSSKPSSAAAMEIQRQRVENHQKVRRLASKAAAIFQEIQRYDEECPVGMGGGVAEFLEGFLEEILVRVEAAEEPESPKKA
jgi:serine/threonine-protein kinase 24/25/MST4